MPARKLILVLGDQLSPSLAALRAGDPGRDRVVMAEVMAEASYVAHHKKKIAFIFAAMRHFAEELRAAGWRVDYAKLSEPEAPESLKEAVARAVERHGPESVCVTEPGEWRLMSEMRGWSEALGLPVDILPDDRFLATGQEFAAWAEGRKELRMEFFYREMRRKTGLLMDGDKPAGGRWNFDAENRKPAGRGLDFPVPPRTEPDAITAEVLDLVRARFGGNFGALTPFWFATDRTGAEAALDRFIETALPGFGDYQDAMLAGERFLFHSVLSLYINAGLLDPLAVCRRVEAAWRAGHAPLNAAEGFIRQIVGWREYVRGIYWLRMPGYTSENALGATRPLPGYYWSAETGMACVRQVVEQTREEAYAHHIQRLMVTGTFALIAGIDPFQVHEWYLAVYADAYEWVEAPNVIGMSQFADGGLLASKPYAASGNYIDKMSDYCAGCRYDVKKKTGEGACPFNPLYWHFLHRHRPALSGNRRLARVYSSWDRMGPDKRQAYLDSAEAVLETLETL